MHYEYICRSFETMSVRVMRRFNGSFAKEFEETSKDRLNTSDPMTAIACLYVDFFRGIEQEKQAVEVDRISSHSLCSKVCVRDVCLFV